MEPAEAIPEDPSETLGIALAHHQAGELEAAERLYLHVLTADPHEPTALYLYGMLHLEAGRPHAAEPFLTRVVELKPDVPEGHLALASLAVGLGQDEEAITRYRKVLAIQPGHPLALANLAAILVQRGFTDDGDLEGAMDVCRQAAALLPDPAPAHAMLGGVLLAADRVQESIEAYRAALSTQPSNAAAHAGLAAAQLRAEEPQAALETARTALTLNPRLPEAWLALGSALLALQQPTHAATAFEEGVLLAPNLARMHLGLGDAYAELDRDAESLIQLARAVELDPSSKWAQANLGSVLYRCGRPNDAEPHLRAALELDPDMPVVHQNMAGILAERGLAEESRRHRERAYSLRNLHVVRAPEPRATVLVLTTSDSGNVPFRYLVPKDRYTRIEWFIEYARDGQAAELPEYDIVFNIIGDADYSGPTDEPVAAFIRQCERPVLNDPSRIGPTRRDRLPQLLAGLDGVLVPKVARVDPGAADGVEPAAWLGASGLSLPVLIRPMGSHGGQGLKLARTSEDLAGCDVSAGAYATEFVDFSSPADGRWRKYRTIFVDRAPYPYHLAVKDNWLVHYYTSEMAGDRARQAEELRFLEDPAAAIGEAAAAAIAAIGRRLDLDFAGIDFSLLPDGRVVVFEANATMLAHPEKPGEFGYKNPFVERITSAFQALLERRAREA